MQARGGLSGRAKMNAAFAPMLARMRATGGSQTDIAKKEEPSGQVESSKESSSAVPANDLQVGGSKQNDFGDEQLPAAVDAISVSEKPPVNTFVRGRGRGMSFRGGCVSKVFVLRLCF